MTLEMSNLDGNLPSFILFRNWDLDSYVEYGPESRRPPASERDALFKPGKENEKDKVPAPKTKPKHEEEKSPEKRLKLEKSPEKRLKVVQLDQHVEANVKRHHTDGYECTQKNDPELVIRRGDEFKLTIEFDQPYDKKKHDLSFIFNLGLGSPSKGTRITFKLDEDGKLDYKQKKQWGARIDSKTGKQMTVSVYVPPDCAIGEWVLSLRTYVETKDEKPVIYLYKWREEITIILNPWCKDDEVYFPEEKLLDEYILNEAGCVFIGSQSFIKAKPWNFGQFSEGILDAAMYLVRRGFKQRMSSAVGDPVQIARRLSRVVNDADDGGVLSGNWSGNYAGGKNPCSWGGSVKILRQYMQTKEEVKFGQCWVFSAVLTTVCRAIGFPCRSVTNFASAHDTDISLTIDKAFEFDDEGYVVETENNDSVWNFHVWNEVWMSRNDIGSENGGWQAIDATPQEQSDNGMYCCGPSPVKALKNGDVDKGFDGKFIFAEVNADEVHWYKSRGEYIVWENRKNKVGKFISTHNPTGKALSGCSGNMKNHAERLDLTLEYKHPEGSEEERLAVRKAVTAGKGKRNPYVGENAGVELQFEENNDVFVGQNFAISMTITNPNDRPVTVEPSMTVTGLTYTDTKLETFLKKKFDVKVLQKGQVQKFTANVEGEMAFDKLDDSLTMHIVGTTYVKEKYIRAKKDYYVQLLRPDVVMEGPKTCKIDQTIKVKISYTNLLNRPLTNCSLDFDGDLLCVAPTTDPMNIGTIKAKSKYDTTVTLKPKATPKTKTEREVNVTLDCDEKLEAVGTFSVKLVA